MLQNKEICKKKDVKKVSRIIPELIRVLAGKTNGKNCSTDNELGKEDFCHLEQRKSD